MIMRDGWLELGFGTLLLEVADAGAKVTISVGWVEHAVLTALYYIGIPKPDHK